MAHVLNGTWFYRMRIALVLHVHILAARGRAMSLMTPVLSKYGANVDKKSEFTEFAARDAKFEREYLCTGSRHAYDILQFKTCLLYTSPSPRDS